MHLSATQLEFLERLGRSPEGQQLQALIRAEIDDTTTQLRTGTGEVLYRAQGKATYLVELAAKLNPPKQAQARTTKPAHFQPAPGSFA